MISQRSEHCKGIVAHSLVRRIYPWAACKVWIRLGNHGVHKCEGIVCHVGRSSRPGLRYRTAVNALCAIIFDNVRFILARTNL